MGGTDEPSNLVLLTVEEHAEAHRKLFEQYGKKQDELAWKGLLGLIDKEEMSRELASLNGKKWLGKKHSESTKLKTWKIITPEGTSFIVDNLVEYCRYNNLNHSKMTSVKKYGYLHKGFYCEKVV